MPNLCESLVACAMGVALGLLTDSARAANVELYQEPVYSADGTDWAGLSLCQRTNGTPDIRMMLYSTEAEARRWAGLTLTSASEAETGRSRSSVRHHAPTSSSAGAVRKRGWGTITSA